MLSFASDAKLPLLNADKRPLLDAFAEAAAMPRLLATMIRSMVDAWPDEVYSKGWVETRVLGRPTAFLCDPSLIRSLLVDQADSLVREEAMTRALAPAMGSGILTSDGSRWRAQRRTAAPVFRPDRLRDLVPAVADASQATADRWMSKAAGEPFDLLAEMMRTTLDVIVATTTSGHGELDVEAFAHAMDVYLSQTNWKVALAMLGAPAWLPHPGSRRGTAASRHLRAATARLVQNRRAQTEIGPDLLGLLMAARDPETGRPMSDELLVDNLLTFVAAGHETTALALTWTLRLLCDHPRVQTRVVREIVELGGDLRSEPERLEGLAYTQQVLMEALRLFPPAPLIVRRTSREVRLGSLTILAGNPIHIPIYAIHRHERLWDRPTDFNPERFAPEMAAKRDRYAYLPFGAGPRICIGMGLAMTECLVILATLLPRFHLRPVEASMPATRFRVTLRPHGGMPVYVTPRSDL